MPTTFRFIEPMDVLFLRGNKLFGDPGSHGESLVPPWPSVAAGALRSMILAAEHVDMAAFAHGSQVHRSLGSPSEPGTFTVTGFDLARRDQAGRVESLHALPADLIAHRGEDSSIGLSRLVPQAPPVGLSSSAPVAQWPVLAQGRRAKAVGGFWLTQHGWEDHLAGRLPATSELVATADLWQFDARVGVGLDATTGHADDGKLFTTQAVAFRRGVGFLAAVRGAELPNSGMLRFGGDGRSAYMTAVPHLVRETDWAGIAGSRRCRIVLTTPGLFSQGWQLPGLDSDHRLDWGGIKGRLVSAAVARAEVVSGWDLATRQPKSALRAAPSGSTYWIDDLVATPEQLRKLAEQGLWNKSNHNPARRAEGFNRFAFATY